jgi:hypothetical protein
MWLKLGKTGILSFSDSSHKASGIDEDHEDHENLQDHG